MPGQFVVATCRSREFAEKLASEYPGRVAVFHRPAPLGISSAYLQGFHRMLQRDVHAICQMDADLSYDPSTLIDVVKYLETLIWIGRSGAEGSRYGAT